MFTVNITQISPRLGVLQMSERKDYQSETGAVRSAESDYLDFMSMPLLGLLGVARTTFEGGTKYGRYNYLKGMPVHVILNHVFRHLIMYALGDRSEPHLEHAAWGCLAASQSALLHPELSAPHLPGPGYTLTSAVEANLEAGNAERSAKRKSGEFDYLGDWCMHDLAEVVKLLEQRSAKQQLQAEIAASSQPNRRHFFQNTAAGEEAYKRDCELHNLTYVSPFKNSMLCSAQEAADRSGIAQATPDCLVFPSTEALKKAAKADRRVVLDWPADNDGTTEHITFTKDQQDFLIRNGVVCFPYSSQPADAISWVNQYNHATKSAIAENESKRFLPGAPPITKMAAALGTPPGLQIYVKDRNGVRYEEARGIPTPGPGETWCEYEGGHRLYWLDETHR